MYKVFLNHLASHGFVVIASDSLNVAQGDPPPMVAGVTWVLEQNDDPTSVMYQRIDTAHRGATGHSRGGMATSRAGGDDSHIYTTVPICGAAAQRDLSGPAMIVCGGADEIVPCCSNITSLPDTSECPLRLEIHSPRVVFEVTGKDWIPRLEFLGQKICF